MAGLAGPGPGAAPRGGDAGHARHPGRVRRRASAPRAGQPAGQRLAPYGVGKRLAGDHDARYPGGPGQPANLERRRTDGQVRATPPVRAFLFLGESLQRTGPVHLPGAMPTPWGGHQLPAGQPQHLARRDRRQRLPPGFYPHHPPPPPRRHLHLVRHHRGLNRIAMNAPTACILVVDDEPDLRTLYELTLLREGYRVETAASVQEAREQIKANRFDVVIADMRLPDGFGMELLQDLREQQRRERCVVMTAYGSAEKGVEALRCGAFDYLTKPVDLRQFRSVVASAVQGTGGVVPVRRSGPSHGRQPSASIEPPPAVGAGAAPERLIGASQAMCNVPQRVAKIARGMAPA